jgi:hypothetical protein
MYKIFLQGADKMPPVIIAAAIVAASAITTTAVTVYQSSAQATKERHTQEDLLDQQKNAAKAAEDKVAGAKALAEQTAAETLKKKRMAQIDTVLTSPLGVQGSANVGTSTLLGG